MAFSRPRTHTHTQTHTRLYRRTAFSKSRLFWGVTVVQGISLNFEVDGLFDHDLLKINLIKQKLKINNIMLIVVVFSYFFSDQDEKATINLGGWAGGGNGVGGGLLWGPWAAKG